MVLVRDVMNRTVFTCEKNLNIVKAASIMVERGIGSLIVVDNNKIVGVITNRDIMKAVARGEDLSKLEVKDIMTKKVITISASNTIEEAVDLMLKFKIKRLPVVEGDKLIGIVTVSDIIVVEPKIIQNLASLLSIKLSGYKAG
ncbi:MAG: CBS domain-containing protein [Candidatus Aenigmarchaeota archaeon]|nr:CBS domain-containing protein [Candidatus Aenigmarchaeota archaeon]MDW8149435.1 CBS domain-containing protein [Candidatus Aenigmarchaeota archaeon]